MNKKELQLCKTKILKCLTEDFPYGRRKDGSPLKRPRKNHALFDKQDGYLIWTSTDLKTIMDKVVLGLYFALEDSKVIRNKD